MTPLRVLSVYEAYLQRGGEDMAFESEADLLEKNGHTVHRFRVEADELRQLSLMKRPRIAAQSLWSQRYYRLFRRLGRELRPDIVHFHNTFPLVSPAAYIACKQEGVPVVHTLHNYRLLCPSSTFFRDGAPCEDCLGRRVPWPSVVHSCYHDSAVRTSVIATMLSVHRMRGTWQNDIDLYFTPSAFSRRKFIEGGFDPERVVVKPNFVDYHFLPQATPGNFFLFVGRLVDYKGIRSMLDAWRRLNTVIPLRIIGDGPMENEVTEAARQDPNISYLGRQPSELVMTEMRSARALIFPSIWYEMLPITILEAFAAGLPVISADIGAMGAELVEDGRNGLLFAPGQADDLAAKVYFAWSQPHEMLQMGRRAQAKYRLKYTAASNYKQLIQGYQKAAAIADQSHDGTRW